MGGSSVYTVVNSQYVWGFQRLARDLDNLCELICISFVGSLNSSFFSLSSPLVVALSPCLLQLKVLTQKELHNMRIVS